MSSMFVVLAAVVLAIFITPVALILVKLYRYLGVKAEIERKKLQDMEGRQ